MSDKSEDRRALEARATELGVDFAPNIGDAKLAERVAAAEAAAGANAPNDTASGPHVPDGAAGNAQSNDAPTPVAPENSPESTAVAGAGDPAAPEPQPESESTVPLVVAPGGRVRLGGKVRTEGYTFELSSEQGLPLVKTGAAAIRSAPDA